jgi:hypothetical protein
MIKRLIEKGYSMKLKKPKGRQVFRSSLASVTIALVLLAGGLLAIQQTDTTSNPHTREGYSVTRDSILALKTDSNGIRVNGIWTL